MGLPGTEGLTLEASRARPTKLGHIYNFTSFTPRGVVNLDGQGFRSTPQRAPVSDRAGSRTAEFLCRQLDSTVADT